MTTMMTALQRYVVVQTLFCVACFKSALFTQCTDRQLSVESWELQKDILKVENEGPLSSMSQLGPPPRSSQASYANTKTTSPADRISGRL